MTKTLGCNNYFQGNGLYYLKAIIPYIQKIEPTLLVPQSWSTGGGLNDKAKKFGILPDWENNKEGRGHQAKYKGTTMYKFSKLLINELKTLAPRKPRLTPIEKANKEAQKQEDNNELPEIKTGVLEIKTGVEEEIEKLKELLANAGPTKLEVVQDTVPKGFIEVIGTHHERLLILAKDVQQVCEVVPGARFVPSYLSGEEAHANSIIFARATTCTLNTYDELLEKLRKASEV